jgi:quercetin 2,3-dioxygenase
MDSTEQEKIVHRADSRGLAFHGWLTSRHTFSFAGYHNPDRLHFGALKVINDDLVVGGRGFGAHPHDNIEIITIPLAGSLVHEDNTGQHVVIQPNDIQIMSAGKGITHSETNGSKTEEVKFLQIWILPQERNIAPRYEKKSFNPANRQDKFQVVVSPDENAESLWINQDAYLSWGNFAANNTFTYDLKKPGNGIYILVLEGEVEIAAETLSRRDALGLTNTERVELKTRQPTELLVLEVPMNIK